MFTVDTGWGNTGTASISYPALKSRKLSGSQARDFENLVKTTVLVGPFAPPVVAHGQEDVSRVKKRRQDSLTAAQGQEGQPPRQTLQQVEVRQAQKLPPSKNNLAAPLKEQSVPPAKRKRKKSLAKESSGSEGAPTVLPQGRDNPLVVAKPELVAAAAATRQPDEDANSPGVQAANTDTRSRKRRRLAESALAQHQQAFRGRAKPRLADEGPGWRHIADDAMPVHSVTLSELETAPQAAQCTARAAECRKRQDQDVAPPPIPASAELAQQQTGKKRNRQATQADSLEKATGTAQSQGLLDRLSAKLSGSRFRWLNETLYTSSSNEAFALLQDQPELFTQYHEGFERQTKGWPLQPVDAAIAWLRTQPPSLRVADFGCGDARLALSVPQRVACLDLVAARPGVIACNMSDTPLESGSVDVAVFCLALMGTDYPDFLREATRVLKRRGTLWIAEVRSRFADGGAENFAPFLAALGGLGYALAAEDVSNRFFVVFRLRRTGSEAAAPPPEWPQLKPCLYKRR